MRKFTSVLRVDKPGFTVKKLSRRSLKKRSESLSRCVDEQTVQRFNFGKMFEKNTGK
jgi:hypothetical protein